MQQKWDIVYDILSPEFGVPKTQNLIEHIDDWMYMALADRFSITPNEI